MGALHFYRTPHYCIIYAGVNNVPTQTPAARGADATAGVGVAQVSANTAEVLLVPFHRVRPV